LAGLGAEALRPDLDELGVEEVDDLAELDQEDVEKLKEQALQKMRKVKAKKFIKELTVCGAGGGAT
jgi:predicted flap endonuclease-1-like 5' DNA nuclease